MEALTSLQTNVLRLLALGFSSDQIKNQLTSVSLHNELKRIIKALDDPRIVTRIQLILYGVDLFYDELKEDAELLGACANALEQLAKLQPDDQSLLADLCLACQTAFVYDEGNLYDQLVIRRAELPALYPLRPGVPLPNRQRALARITDVPALTRAIRRMCNRLGMTYVASWSWMNLVRMHYAAALLLATPFADVPEEN